MRKEFSPGSQIVSFGSNGILEYCVSLYIPKINAIVVTIHRLLTCDTQYIRKVDMDIEYFEILIPRISTAQQYGRYYVFNLWYESAGRNSIRIFGKYCLVQCVTEPTRLHNILDKFLTNNENLIRDIDIIDTSISDHRLVLVRTCITILSIYKI